MKQLEVISKDSAQNLINEFREDINSFLDSRIRELVDDADRSSYYSDVVKKGYLISIFHSDDTIPSILMNKFWCSIRNFKHFQIEITPETISVYFNAYYAIEKSIIKKWIDSGYNQKDFENAVLYHIALAPISEDEAMFLVICIAIMIVLDRGIPSEN